MGIFNEFNKKEKPVFTGIVRGFGGFGFGASGGGGDAGGSGIDLTMYLWGAGGGDRNNASEPGNGGSGGFMQASGATFEPSDTIYVYVGSPGITPGEEGPASLPSVFGGAPSQAGGSYSGAGGGASYVTLNGERTNGSGSGTVIAVAGGGGGNGYSGGGGGGYPTGGTGGGYDGATGGSGGTQSAGGTGGNNDHTGTGSNGAFLLGGNQGPGSSSPGGGGGGGYYGGGGGGGANSNSGGSGGGGSSYVNPTYVTADAHTTGDSDSTISGPAPLISEHIQPKWHNRGGGEDYPSTTGGSFNAGRRTSGGCESGGRGRVVLTNGTWKRTFNFSGRVENIPASYSPAGLDFTLDSTSNHDGPYDKGFGWGHGPGKGCCVYSDASTSSVTATFTFTSGSGSGDRTFTSFEVFTHAANGKSSLTGQFNSDTPFSFPTHTSDPGTPSGDLAPHFPGGDISSFKITNPGGSGNTHLFVHEIRINGATVDFGRNYI